MGRPAITDMPGFAGQPLDRADHLRRDPARVAALRARSDSLLMTLDGLAPRLDGDDRLLWTKLAAMKADSANAEEEWIFLGLRQGVPLFVPVFESSVFEGGEALPAGADRSGWAAIARLSPDELAIYGVARSLVDWHRRHRFCSCCGQGTRIARGGWQRVCPACGAEHFPRVDPVVIMLVEQGDSLLLGRETRFPPGIFSTLAGYVEPGESAEETVAREVREEVGLVVRDVRYLASQPWPFPSQLMIGCHCFADSRALVIDYEEIEDARWFTRAEVAEAVAKGDESTSFRPPPLRSIARLMLEYWLEQG